jgi:REP element-mobilizing transposase RayT
LDLLQGPDRSGAEPWAYFITFACYGERLHGDKRGSVDPNHNGWRTPYITTNPNRQHSEQQRIRHGVAHLSADSRDIVLAAIRSVAQHESWTLHAAHVRSTHVHTVITASIKPETIVGKLKAYSSRALNQASGKRTKRWSRHGSTLWLWDAHKLARTIEYVVHGQGPTMACYQKEVDWTTTTEPQP